MTQLLKISPIFFALILSACGHIWGLRGGGASPDLEDRVDQLVTELNKSKQQNQELADRNKVLETRMRLRGKSVQDVVTTQSDVRPAPKVLPSDEKGLFREALKAYQQQDINQLEATTDLILKNYPAGSFSDNAIFLEASLDLRQKRFDEALKAANNLIDNYPLSNKVAASYLLKAQVYNQLNDKENAKKYLNEILTKYPGSPEHYRAQMELSLINSTPTVN